MTSEQTESKQLPLPDVGDLLFIGVMHILLVGRPDYMFQDASIGWHLTAGKWILENKAIPHTDLFSYTFPDKGWVAYEWLFDLVAYIVTTIGGFNLLAVAISATIAFVFVKVYDRAREDGGPLGIAAPAAIVGIFASSVHWLARPHIITFLCVYFYMKRLEDFYRGSISSKKLLVSIGLFMLLWVNCHPQFLFGIAFVGAYFGFALLSYMFGAKENKVENLQKTKILFFAGLLAVGVTVLNPYGLELHQYISEYLKGSTVLANTDEFKSPDFHWQIENLHAILFELLIACFLSGLAVAKKRLSAPYFAITLLFLHLSLSAVRNIPIFAILVVPAIGLLFSQTRISDWARPVDKALPFLKAFVDKYARPFKEFDAQERHCKMRILAWGYLIFMTVAALCGGSIAGMKILNSGFSPTEMPTKTLAFLKDSKLNFDRGFNYDNWGGLIRYQLDKRVFIDDRADFYGEKFYKQYGVVVQTDPGWQKILDDNKIEWVLMPSNATLSAKLKETKGWKIAAQDEGSFLFVRDEIDANTVPSNTKLPTAVETKPTAVQTEPAPAVQPDAVPSN